MLAVKGLPLTAQQIVVAQKKGRVDLSSGVIELANALALPVPKLVEL
ncbi:hypothetical protein [Gallaecimonas mangrovi]|nr:hypothetical protein [Gallaecimonas mangrovi]